MKRLDSFKSDKVITSEFERPTMARNEVAPCNPLPVFDPFYSTCL